MLLYFKREFILLEIVVFYIIRNCCFYEVSINFCKYIQNKKDSKAEILKVSFIGEVLVPYM